MSLVTTRRSLRARLVPGLATIALSLAVCGCATGPKAPPVPTESAQERILQQTVSQLRKNLDEVRMQRDIAQEQVFKAERELDTAHRELTFLESRVRVERELGTSRGQQLGDLQGQFLESTAELRKSRERVAKLERELTTMRAAFDQDQMKVAQLETDGESLSGQIASLQAKLSAANEAWEIERRSMREALQAREDEIAMLSGKVSRAESDLKKSLASAPPRPAPAPAVDTPAAATTDPEVAAADPEPAVAGSTDDPLWKRKAKEALSIVVGRFKTFIANPAENWRALAHPAPILFVFFAIVMPLVMFFRVRRRLRRRSVRRHAERVAVQAAAAAAAAPSRATRSERRPMPSVAIPRRREIIPTGTPQDGPSPASAGSVAATLDAVLGGDPVSDQRATQSKDEDDLIGELRDIVHKGLR